MWANRGLANMPQRHQEDPRGLRRGACVELPRQMQAPGQQDTCRRFLASDNGWAAQMQWNVGLRGRCGRVEPARHHCETTWHKAVGSGRTFT